MISTEEMTTRAAYARALRRYLAHPDEEALAEAYELGREALQRSQSLIGLTDALFAVLEAEVAASPDPAGQQERISRAAEFLTETLSIDELTRASFQEASESSARLLQLATTIAHEFRTPLTSILLSAGLLQEELPPDTPEPTRELVGHITAGAQLIKAQTDDLLDLVAFQAGGLGVELALLEPRSLLPEILARLRPVVAQAGLVFAISVPEALPPIWGDRRRIEQLVGNLVSNAVKYGLSGGRVEVSADVEGRMLVLRVRDYGPGIAPADQRLLFQPFFRAPRHRRVAGLGVGLALVREIVQAHGGTISVWSAEGEGTQFTVRLPQADQLEAPGSTRL